MRGPTATTKILSRATRWGQVHFLRMLVFSLLVLCLGARLMPAEITTYMDKNGHRVYVNSEDHELHAAISRGGVEAASRVIEERKHALPAIEEYIGRVAFQYQLDPQLVIAMIEVESAWDPKARSSKGALGLMQLMPETAARFRVHDPLDPRKNVEGGVRYLRLLLDRFDQNLTSALAAYNAGETVVAKRGGIPPYEETQNYVRRVRERFAELQGRFLPSLPGLHRTVVGGRTVYTNIA
jgi:soluble lytic murein transglycosylase-like protein